MGIKISNNNRQSGGIGLFILVAGIILSTLAIDYNNSMYALIGISLVFWGALFFYIKPKNFVKNEVLNSAISNTYEFYDLVFKNLDFIGTPIYIAPDSLWGLNNVLIVVTRTPETQFMLPENINDDVFEVTPEMIKMTPPGLEISRLIENQLNTSFATETPDKMQPLLEKALIEELEIARTLEISIQEPFVHVELRDTVFDEIIDKVIQKNNVQKLGDPLTSAICCLTAKTMRKPVTIEKIQKDPHQRTTKIIYRIHENT
jgi:hypothetical protein